MATERIEQLISKEALAQFDELNAKLALSITGFEKLVQKGVDINKALGGNMGIKKFNEETKALDENQKALDQQTKQLVTTEAKLNATFTTTAEKLAQAKVVSGEVNKQLRDQAKEALGLVSAYDKLTKEYNEAAKVAKNLAVQQGAGSKAAQDASKKALELDARLKAADANVGRFNKNVGNYSGAMKVLEKALNDVKKKMDDYVKAGKSSPDVVAALVKEESLLTQLLTNQSAGFKNATQEVRANTKAIQQMAAAGLQGTEAYHQLFAATAELKDETSDLSKALQNAAPDDVAINAASDAARGLVGVYGLAQSAAAAFGVDNEALQETMVKLQAAETALQSIEAIRAVFKKENAVRQLINIGLQKVEIVQTNLQTATESRSTIVKYGAIAAQKTLNAVMALSGGPLLAIVGLIALLVISLSAFASSASKAGKSFTELNDALEINARLTEDSLKAINNASEKIVADLEANFADEKTIRDKKAEYLQKQLDKQTKFNEKERGNYERADDFIRNSLKRKDDLSKKEQKELDAAIEFRDNYEKESAKQYDIEHSLDLLRLENKKADTEDYIDAQRDNIEAQKISLQSTAQGLQSIIADERKSYAERIEALKQFQKIQDQITNAEAKSKRLDPSLTPTQLKVVEKTRQAAILQSRRETDKQVEALSRESIKREEAAQFELAKISVETRAEAQQQIAENENNSLDVRLDAMAKGFESEQSLIVAQRDFELKNANILKSEREAIEARATAELLSIRSKFLKDVADLNKQQVEKDGQANQDITSTRRDNLLKQLNEEYQAGTIGKEEFESKKYDIETQYAKESIQLAIDTVRRQLEVAGIGYEQKKALLAQLADYELQLAEETTNQVDAKEEKAFQKKVKRADLYAKIVSGLSSIIEDISSIGFDQESARLSAQETALYKRSEKEKAVAEATIQNETEKANAISLIDARTQAQKEQIERRRRQLEYDRARVERALTIGRIIADTAAAVVAALGAKPYTPANIALAAVTGAIGAAQLAKAIATPLPKLAHGTDDAPGGNVIVGDGGRKEMVITPEGKLIETPASPTVMNIPKHSIVHPDANEFMKAGINNKVLAYSGSRSPSLDISELKREMQLTRKAIQNKRENHYGVTHSGVAGLQKYGADWWKYIDQQIHFKS